MSSDSDVEKTRRIGELVPVETEVVHCLSPIYPTSAFTVGVYEGRVILGPLFEGKERPECVFSLSPEKARRLSEFLSAAAAQAEE